VAVESPTYFGTLQTLEINGLRALEIPTHPRDGISLEALEFAIEHNPIRAVLVIPTIGLAARLVPLTVLAIPTIGMATGLLPLMR
jgi:hypothetical protein